MPLNKKLVRRVVREALLEDAASRDITTLDFIQPRTMVEAKIIAKERGVVCGALVSAEVFRSFDPGTRIKILKKDGAKARRSDCIMTIRGRGRSILSCERVALNFLSYLSGISTQTAEAVLAVRSAGIRILDTRKTTPMLRAFEKHAVLVGGGKNHRLDLSDQYLAKDNHIYILKATSSMDALALRDAKVPFEIEVDTLADLKKVLAYGPNIVMLDNFSPSDTRRAVRLLARIFPGKEKRPFIELSGGINLDNLRRYAIKGVDFISLGSLTHSARALDFSLEIVKVHRS